MSTETVDKTPQETEGLIALIFELEHVAINGRAIAYDVLKQILSDKGIDLTPVLYSRYCVGYSPDQFLGPLFSSAKVKLTSENKLISEIEKSMKMAVLDGAVKLSPGVADLVKCAKEEGVVISALTGLDEGTAGQLMEKLGFAGESSGVVLHCADPSSRDFPTADCWLKAAKQLEVRPSRCVTVGSSSTAAKAALSAGMRCISVPDGFTAFQDFSGSDYVVDEVERESFKDLVRQIRN